MSCPVKHDASESKELGANPIDSECPVKHNTAASDLVFGQEKLPNQTTNLSTKRETSTILKSDFSPAHQPGGSSKWVYPSEQQYYNAMKRKGYNPREDDVPVILAIHNTVNEKAWSQVREWEALAGSSDPKLKRFEGRPKDISPKAYFLNLMGYALPFDRHDWVVDRNGRNVRYIIDFYAGQQLRESGKPLAPIAMHLDVRPALDSVQACFERLDFTFRSMFKPLTMPRIWNQIAKSE